ncbi:MAG: putative inorganic carbon transporter subunit DabA, partial [Myxococcota bacterium]
MNAESQALAPQAGADGVAARVDLDAAVDAAIARVAPSWPLDRFIAVNPLWGFVETPLPEASARLEALSGSRIVRPRPLARRALETGRLTRTHLEAALARHGSELRVETLLAALQHDEERAPRQALMTDVVDAARDLTKAMAWKEIVPHVISQHCADYFARLGLDPATQPAAGEGLFASWRALAATDRAPELLVGGPSLREHAAALPTSRDGVLRLALGELDVDAQQLE